MNVSIIGGGGLVGSCAAYALQCGGIVSQINLVDLNADLCRGQALDLLHGASLVADQRIGTTSYDAIPASDLVMITAGLRRKPDESRLDLINRNVELFLSILGHVKAAGLKREATVLGEHGDSMVPIWSAAQAGGMPLDKFPGWTSSTADALFARTRGSGAEVIKLKGGAGFAVGLSIAEVIHAIALDRKRILPVASLVSGVYDIRDVCLSVPTVVGRAGVEAQLEIDLWPKEVSALQHSGQVLRETIDQVLKKNPAAAKPTPKTAESRPAPAPSGNGQAVRVTMGSGGHSGGGSA